MQNQRLKLALLFTATSGVSMVITALIPGGSAWAASLVVGGAEPETIAARLSTGIAGALMTGWMVTLFHMLASVERSNSESIGLVELGRALLLGIVTWFLLDSLVSLVLAANLNLLFNLIYLVLIGGAASGCLHTKPQSTPSRSQSAPQGSR